jgi:hypothetical protein
MPANKLKFNNNKVQTNNNKNIYSNNKCNTKINNN